MITRQQIVQIGVFGKPHGISGEINAVTDIDADGIGQLSCIVIDVDSIFVPFFIDSVRPKGKESVIVKIDGYESDVAVKQFVGKEIFALNEEVDDADDEDMVDARIFIGYDIVAIDGDTIGRIDDVDFSTSNYLFKLDNGLLIPIADEFIIEIDDARKRMVMQLPEGITEL